MCVNHTPATRKHLKEVFDAPVQPHLEWPAETFPDHPAPIFEAPKDGSRETLVASFGMIPKAHLPSTVKHFSTMNARSETVSTLSS
jgi:putative SOS response-associated peptidase YedK